MSSREPPIKHKSNIMSNQKKVAAIKRQKATKRNRPFSSSKPFQAVIPSGIMEVEHQLCKHTFCVCESVAQYHGEKTFPCPVCEPDCNFLAYDIVRMRMS